jgi:hypothetical protein
MSQFGPPRLKRRRGLAEAVGPLFPTPFRSEDPRGKGS